ncbi:MAG: hypothetical protein HUU21_11480 [Polyangiaceae bacterium]|nr:hypothetical protein [Polyangiaceae bacterium]NUQ74167.1 hypothetical protein [Polyangiaceae bacterium]
MDSDNFKLVKLTIVAFKDATRKEPLGKDKEFEAMFNPASYTQTHVIPWAKQKVINASQQTAKYTGSLSDELSLDLILDGTGVTEMGVLAGARKSVAARLEEFFATTLRYNGEIHEPNYLRVEWGILSFDCRLSRTSIRYTSFDPRGVPLRAELSVTLISDTAPEKRAKTEDKKSPDVTHARVVRSGDTLPLLTKSVYGSSARFLDVARWNGLDDFRDLSPGRKLLFPPLAVLDRLGGDGGSAKG